MVESSNFAESNGESVVYDPLNTATAADNNPNNRNNNSASEELPEEENQEEEESDDIFLGAGIIGGIVGFLLGGPILATIAGFCAAHYAQEKGIVGDTARAVGEVALFAKDKALEVNEKHQIVNKGKQAANEALEKAKEMNHSYGIENKVKELALATLNLAIKSVRSIVKKLEDMEESSADAAK